MAIPNNYIDKITKEGDSRPICPAADKVRVDNENFDGADLDAVLDEVAEAIEDAGGGYNPPAGGIPKTDLAPGVQASLDKADTAVQDNEYTHTDNNYTDAEKTKLAGLPTNPVTSISVNGQAPQTPTNGNVNLVVEAGGLTEEDINVATQQDGVVVLTFGNDSYSINLNHTHPQYAAKKTVESNTNATVTLSADVIYDLGTVSGNKTINLPSTVDAAAEYEFRLSYTSGTISGTAISGTTVANDATLTFTAGKSYQVIISGGILYFSETTVS